MTRIDVYRPKVPRLDLGSGPTPREGYVGVDRLSAENVLPWDFSCPDDWPWEDESIEALVSSHCIEHLPPVNAKGRDVLIHFMEQAWRVAVPGALFELRWPAPFHPDTGAPMESAWWDPTHYRRIPAAQIPAYFSNVGRRTLRVESYGIRCNWVMTHDVLCRSIAEGDRIIEYVMDLRRDPL